MTFEVIAAASLLRKWVPAMKVRVVNVTDLMILGAEGTHPHAMTDDDFESLFTEYRRVVVNYHGYVNDVKGLLYGRKGVAERFQIEGYREEGSTITPFDVRKLNPGYPINSLIQKLTR